MNRVPASLAVVMLAASGHPVSPITLRSWVYRGHISRQEGGYDLREILDYIERREKPMNTLQDLFDAAKLSRSEPDVRDDVIQIFSRDGGGNGQTLLAEIQKGPDFLPRLASALEALWQQVHQAKPSDTVEVVRR